MESSSRTRKAGKLCVVAQLSGSAETSAASRAFYRPRTGSLSREHTQEQNIKTTRTGDELSTFLSSFEGWIRTAHQ
jgi:hypothetical protein